MYEVKYDKVKINGVYMGISFANSIGVTKSRYLADRHKAKGAIVNSISPNNGLSKTLSL